MSLFPTLDSSSSRSIDDGAHPCSTAREARRNLAGTDGHVPLSILLSTSSVLVSKSQCPPYCGGSMPKSNPCLRIRSRTRRDSRCAGAVQSTGIYPTIPYIQQQCLHFPITAPKNPLYGVCGPHHPVIPSHQKQRSLLNHPSRFREIPEKSPPNPIINATREAPPTWIPLEAAAKPLPNFPDVCSIQLIHR
jgi:hypothetical protein